MPVFLSACLPVYVSARLSIRIGICVNVCMDGWMGEWDGLQGTVAKGSLPCRLLREPPIGYPPATVQGP